MDQYIEIRCLVMIQYDIVARFDICWYLKKCYDMVSIQFDLVEYWSIDILKSDILSQYDIDSLSQ